MPAVQTLSTVLDPAFEAFNEGDPEPLIDAYAQDAVLLIGTDEPEYLERHEDIASALRAEAGSARVDWELRALALGADAAVLAGRLSFVLADGTVIGTRATYAVRREPTGWRIAHSHLSVPRRS